MRKKIIKKIKVSVDKRGTTYHYLNGQLSRKDGPAVIYADGDKFWFRTGSIYRANDLPAIEYANGDKAWYINGTIMTEQEFLAHKLNKEMK